ncbi:MAG: 2-amino-4-hydroxy-6-hydroxymethyldihydropteridine diphosphokinase [Armatimonadota bacterium]|nr:2-amino-4-hydroxy-6-hydroxymethyldihydropteridine diphosphokinase [Armatimonadota bacterium]
MARVFVAIGSNIDPERNVREAVRALAREVQVVGTSTIYAIAPLRRPEQPTFYNAVAEIETDIPPRKLKFKVLRRIEAQLGRVRTEDRWAARTIDLDIAVYDDLVISDEDLHIPDPEIAERPFLAVPLAELAPDLALPGIERTLSEIAAAFGDRDMRPLPEYTQSLREETGA